MPKHLLWRLALGALISLGASAAFADADPPGRVGRLSYIEGAVSFHTADQDQWSPATLNYPVVAGESFWTEPQSRAEIEVGAAEFRLDEATALDVIALDDRTTRLQLAQGVINLHLRAVPQGGVQVLTPQGAIDLAEPGSYHIDAGHPAADAPPELVQVTVLEGRAQGGTRRGRVEIFAGESALIGGNPVTFTLSEGNSTPFDDWALERERREEALAATHYVSPETTGYQDLDPYGTWGSEPAYGAVWYPTAVAADWAPYRYGHWAWVAPWGWTWIDDAPWGFAPFHYGRWVFVGGRWAWCPGAVVARPVYAPALVAFIGGGWTVAVASGPAVGWVPLAPFEVYRPYYRTSVTYVRNINVTSVHRTVINNITTVNQTTVVTNYANRHGATVVPSAAFTRAAPVHRAAIAVPREELARARIMPTVEHLRPTPPARATTASPEGAERRLSRPDMPKPPVRAEGLPPGHAEAAAPGPRFTRPADREPAPPLPPTAQGPAARPTLPPRDQASRPLPAAIPAPARPM
ncbi:MAG TPA: DUF6600 domain-containing protein, partial [Stellaceae bacterium]